MSTGAGGRSERLRGLLSAHDLDALVITTPTNIRYATGFTGSNGRVVLRADAIHLITDSRYIRWATDEIATHDPDIELAIAAGNGRQHIVGLLEDAKSIGLEADHLSWAEAESFQSELGVERVLATRGLVEALREHKAPEEIEKLQAAADVGDAALSLLIPELRPGLSEVDVARRLAQHMYEHSGALPSFDIIVATGPNSAKPHHEPTTRLIEAGDLLIIDSGATVAGYLSDMTRSFVFGEPTAQQQEMLDVVLVAQQEGVDAVKAGVSASEIDGVCRASIGDAGYGEYFTHGTGHGVGIDIHEAPAVSSVSTATLAPGHVVTVEPGVYIPDVGGVRWEDTVVVTEDGAQPLTRSPKQPHITL